MEKSDTVWWARGPIKDFFPKATLELNSGILSLKTKAKTVFQAPASSIKVKQWFQQDTLKFTVGGKNYNVFLYKPISDGYGDPKLSRAKDWKEALRSAGAILE